MNIDFVVTWVDGSDPNWLLEKRKYSPDQPTINTEIRYRDYGTFKYFFRGIEKYAPWVHRIYVVTAGHYPEWLNLESDKIILVKHSDYMPDRFLPTFSSNPIEINLHRIETLSEHFVLFNDDTFLIDNVSKDDFFHNDLPRSFGVYSPVIPYREFSDIIFNNVRLINRHFKKYEDIRKNWKKIFNVNYGSDNLRSLLTLPWKYILGYDDKHLPMSHLKSTFKEIWDVEPNELEHTSMNKFRTISDINHWVFNYWNIENGNFYPQKKFFGKYFTLNDFDKIINSFEKARYKTVCINDDYEVNNYEEKMRQLITLFDAKFPNKSQFEK